MENLENFGGYLAGGVSFEENRGCNLRREVKSLAKDEPVSPFLANIIDSACTSKCDTEDLVKKYKIPKNCDKLCSPIVNSEIWEMIDHRTQTFDKGFQDIQNLVAVSMIPLIKMAEILKEHIMANNEAPSLLSDIMTLMCQVQYNLSLRRRSQIKPNLNPIYKKLCGTNMPITSYLFGDNLGNDMRDCKCSKMTRRPLQGASRRPWQGARRGQRMTRGHGAKTGQGTTRKRGAKRGQGVTRMQGARRGRGGRYHPYTRPTSPVRHEADGQTWHRSTTATHTITAPDHDLQQYGYGVLTP